MELPAHVLCFPFPVLGHINPMMHLAHSLSSSHGFSVTFLLTDHLLPLLASQFSSSISLVSIPDGLSPHDRLGPLSPSKLFDKMASSPAFHDLLASLLHQNPPVSCLISDTFVSWTQVVADKLGVPRAAFWISSASSYLLHLYAPLLISNGYIPAKDKKDQSLIITDFPGVPPLPVAHLPSILLQEDTSDVAFNSLLRLFDNDSKCAWLLLSDFEGLEPEPIQILQQKCTALAVGPLLPLDLWAADASSVDSKGAAKMWKDDNSSLPWLDARPISSVIYVSFGSIASLRKEDIHELALGLESSRHSFLWVLRSDSGSNVSDLLPEGYMERIKAQGLIVSWAPQLKVLAHSSVGGFLTNCGWNSTIESIALGVPFIAMPTDFGEQKTTSWLIEHEWGLGVQLKLEKDGSIRRAGVETTVRTLMEGEPSKAFRSKAAQMKDIAKQSIAQGGSSYNNLHVFAADVRQKYSHCSSKA